MSTAPRTTGHANRDKTVCSRGHRYTEENTYYRPDGRRACYICRREQSRTDQERKMATRTPPPDPAPPAPPLVVANMDGLMALWAQVVKAAVDDYEYEPHESRDYRTAAAWLRGTRLMTADGQIDRHGYPKQARRTRRKG